MLYFNPIAEDVPFLLERLQDEYKAHMFYTNLANWLDVEGYTRAAAWARKEAADELEHALKLQQYLNGWNISYKMPSVTVDVTFTGLVNGLEQAYQDFEAPLYQAYNEGALVAMERDASLYKLLQEMVQIQYESLAEQRTLLDMAGQYNSDKTGVKLFEAEAFG